MNALNLKPTHSAVSAYYQELQQLRLLDQQKEGAVSPAFAALLRHCGRQFNWTLVEQYAMQRGAKTLRIDGALLDSFNLVYGYWEAKDSKDDLPREVSKKFEIGYPQENILFQAPQRAILWQGGSQICDQDISRPEVLVDVLRAFFEYQPPAYEEWQRAVEEFKLKVPELAAGLLTIIEQERKSSNTFVQAFRNFAATCREAINPNLSDQAVEEMLIQHLLTERLFSKVFDNPYFLDHNALARDIKKVILALTSRHFSPKDFLKQLNRFYVSIESTAAVIDDFAQKQAFLNTIYEKFFQGYAVKVADTHGIVYTPQPVVRFMVNSIEQILRQEFGRSLSDKDVHILDPFVGTGNFLIHVLRRINKTALRQKYEQELHCNEVMLLPYYIASMNIEHEYYELTGEYKPFEGVCFVDTFELAEDRQLPLFTEENTARVQRQKKAPIFVILGNPPYNAGQVNENDNNKNRKYTTLDQRVAETYARDSSATLVRKLDDPYIKAIRWASDRLKDEGIVAFVTNHSFIHKISFDGLRKHLAQDFDKIYLIDLGGNVRKNPKLSGSTHNIFGIQVGVSISFFIKKKSILPARRAKIFYTCTEEFWRKEEKYDFLDQKIHYKHLQWKEIIPDKNFTWLTEGLNGEFEAFVPMSSKEAKKANISNVKTIFKTYSLGVSTNRDSVVYGFDRKTLETKIESFCESYNAEVFRYQQKGTPKNIDDFVNYEKIQWSSSLKSHLKRGTLAKVSSDNIRISLYRPFTQTLLYYDTIFNDRPAHFRQIFPTIDSESENRIICIPSAGGRAKFWCFCSNYITNLALTSIDGTQCFPFYIYDEDGSHRRENITDWALAQFRAQYATPSITKWDIFYYVYALLHHPQYREQYAANLKRDLPRIPFVASDLTPNPSPDSGEGRRGEVFWAFVEAGKKLAELHVYYEQQPEYPLQMIENPDKPLNWRVDKMKLSKDKSQIIYNDFLTLAGIPPETFEYRLGNRSPLEWVLDQYRVKTDPRSGIVNDPNRPDDPEYIVRLIKQVVTVSLATVNIINKLPKLTLFVQEEQLC